MYIEKWPRPYHVCDTEPAHFAVEDFLDRTTKFIGLLLDESSSLLDCQFPMVTMDFEWS
jgi:hypothetical protein